jgi:hypothetical protein
VDGIPAVRALLAWELETLTGARGAPLEALLGRWMAAQPARRRLREWARLALHPNRAPLRVSPRRALALLRRSTPRALLYAAAALAHADLARAGQGEAADVSALLPLAGRAAPRTPAEARRALIALWRWCIRNN